MRMTMIASLALLLGSTGFAEEKKVTESEVPKPVLDAVAKKYPKAKKVGFERETEDGKTIYEVRIADAGRKIDIDVSPEGKIRAEEETIALDAIPDRVKQALAHSAKYGKWSLKRAEKIITDEKLDAPTYELVVASDKRAAEVVFDRDGTLLKEEAKKLGDKD